MSNVYEQKFIQSIEAMSQDSVKKSNLPKTIECEINKVEDAAIGLYNVSYMGNSFNVYSSSPSTTYNEKDVVLVLVPEGDFSKTKYILGAVSPSGNMYAAAGQEEQDRIVFDINILPFNDISLCSYIPTDNAIPFSSSDDFIDLLKNYVNDFHNLTFTAKVRTELPGEQQVRGNYGIVLNIPIKIADSAGNASSTEQTWIAARMDINTMEGDVYNFLEYAQQSIDFTFPENAIYDDTRTPYIQAIVDNFVVRDIETPDIFFTDIGLRVVDYLPLNENNGNYLTIVASEGNFFINSLNFSNIKTLTPVLRIDGKDKRVEDYDCYWFVEDTSIRIGSDGYQHYGGEFWRCLNSKTNVETNDDGTETFQWVTNEPILTINKDDILSSLKYKCVLVQDKFYIKGEIEVKNLQATYETELATVSGAIHFNKDTGTINIVARIKELIPAVGTDYTTSLSTVWQRIDKNGIPIEESTNTFKKVRINDLVDGWYETEVSYPCSSVDQLNLIKCTFYQEIIEYGIVANKNIATEEISVTTGEDFVYKISVELDKDVYKYDSNGNSPMVSNYDGPASSAVKEVKPIYFRIFDSDGKELTQTEYKYCDVTWQIPKNSMITYNGTVTSESDDYIYIKKNGQLNSELYFGIRNVYDAKRNDNVIVLTISYQGYILRENIPIRFMKEGENGTNGTKYSAVITYDGSAYGERKWLEDGNSYINNLVVAFVQPAWAEYGEVTDVGIYKARLIDGSNCEYNKIVSFSYPYNKLDINVYKDGELITSNYTIRWSMFDSASTSTVFKALDYGSYCMIDFADDNYSSYYPDWDEPSNIVQARITISSDATDSGRQEELYVYYPIDVAVFEITEGQSFNSNNSYAIPVIEDGYWNVEYAHDGTNPQYNNIHPFKVNFYSRVNDLRNYISSNSWSRANSQNMPYMQLDNKEYTCVIEPAAKYDSGESKNFVELNIDLYHADSWDYDNEEDYPESSIEGAINLKEQEIVLLTDRYTLLRTICSNLELLKHQLDNGENFSYNIYRQYLENSKKLLMHRSYAFSHMDKILELLNSILNYCQDKTVSITPGVSDSIDFIEDMKDKLMMLADPEDETRLSDIYDYLVTSGTTQLTFNNTVQYKELYGLGSYSILNDLIASCNEELLLYFQEITLLKTCTNEFSNFEDLRYRLYEYVNDNEVLSFLTSQEEDLCEEFKIYKNQVETLFDSMSKVYYSYDDIDKIIKKFKMLHDDFNEDYYYNKYNEKANEVLYQKEYAELELEDLISILEIKTVHYYRSVLFLFNRYEMSNLNSWDGNKIYIDEENEQYILAPQMGAGFKESDNSYTGLVMGINTVVANKSGYYSDPAQRIGLLGLDHGVQTIFLNARDGSAVFGKSGPGQIILDPTQNKAMIYSSNYWNSYNTSTGFPSNYRESNISYKGMLINLTDSYIHFGNQVTQEDVVIDTYEKFCTAINTRLIALNKTARVGSNSTRLKEFWDGYLQSGSPFYLAMDSAGSIFIVEPYIYSISNPTGIYLYESSSGSYFKYNISYSGYSSSSRLNVSTFRYRLSGNTWYAKTDGWGTELRYFEAPSSPTSSNAILADAITICKPKNDLTGKVYSIYPQEVLKGGKLYSGTHTSLDNTNDGFYLDKDGLSIGSKFKVTSTGVLTLGDGAVAGSGAHWTIDSNNNQSYIGYNTDGLYFVQGSGMQSSAGTNQVYLGTDGIRLGNKFAVTKTGYLYASEGQIGGWALTSTGLSANGISISSSGNITGSNWSIAAGSATFNNLTANGNGTIGGWTIDGTKLTGGSLTLNGGTGTISGPGFTLSSSGLTGTGFILNSSGLNLTSGRLSLGSGSNRLVWNGTTLTIAGTINANAGEIGAWQIDNNGLYYTGESVGSRSIKVTPTTTVVKFLYCDSLDAYNGITAKKININNASDTNVTIGDGSSGIKINNGGLTFSTTGGGINMNGTQLINAGKISIANSWDNLVCIIGGSEQGLAAYIQSVVGDRYYTKTECDNKFVTATDLGVTLSTYASKRYVDDNTASATHRHAVTSSGVQDRTGDSEGHFHYFTNVSVGNYTGGPV